jgi:STAS-like domain of unknown function (DUF4325)
MTNTKIMIDVGRDFSRYPSGRTPNDSKYSGELFREKFLTPSLRAGSDITIALDGAFSYGSSFLEECFGGLVRVSGFAKDFVREHIKFISEDDILVDEIHSYIDLA